MFELNHLKRLLESNKALLTKACAQTPDNVELMAVAALLHSFYSGMENIFKRIALEIDGRAPAGAQSHAQLLVSMRSATSRRPAVLSESLARSIGDYLSFRHVFRHAYSFNLDWARMSGLASDCGAILERLATELEVFFIGVST